MKIHEHDLPLSKESNGASYSARPSGDGYEILNADGEVIAWTLDRIWSLRILLGLELAASREC